MKTVTLRKKRIEAKYVIVGAGILGSSVLKKLLEEGERDIVVIERENSFGGATAHSFGMLRVFHDSAKLRELALASYRIVSKSPELKLADRREFLSIRTLSPQILANVNEVQNAGYPLEILTACDVESKFGLNLLANEVGILEPEALTFDPHDLLSCYHNATFPQVRVVRDEVSCLMETQHAIDIITAGGSSIRASKAIIAAGIGSMRLLAGRSTSLKPKPLQYDVYKGEVKLPQLLNSRTHEFVSQRKGKVYYRFQDQKVFGEKLNLVSQSSHAVLDVESDSAKESFGQLPGSKRIFYMGAWSGNAFKLSWRLSECITECLLSKTSLSKREPMQENYENAKLL